MCTNIATKTPVTGSAKTASGWMSVNEATMSFDHASHLWVDHALRIDFVDASDENAYRVAVELDLDSGKALLKRLEEVIEAAEKSGVA
jgi:uncharacterized protein YhdP